MSKALPRAIVALMALVLLLPASADAKLRGKKAKEAASIDYQLVRVMHLRDRGDLAEAMATIHEVIGEHPESVSAHRLYQEIAVLSRRNGRLIEAEYRFHLEESPDDPLRKLLHAAATLAAAVVTPGMADRALMKGVERQLAAAEGNPDLTSAAHMVSADLNHLVGDAADVEMHLRAALKADRYNFAVHADLVAFLAQQGKWDEASDLCAGLTEDAPWRLMSCAMLLPRKAGEPSASQEDQDRIAGLLEKVEEDYSDDVVVLQSLEWLYDFLGEKRGSQRLRRRMAELDEAWKPPLERNPYIEPLPGGELTEDEVALIEKIGSLKETTREDAHARVRAIADLETTIPESPRIRAYYYRELAFALRSPDVLDRDASRAAIRKARDATPDDPSIMNEWAYMSAVDEVDLAEALETIDQALEEFLGERFDPLAIDPGGTFSDFEIDQAETVGAFVDTRGWVLYQLGRHEEAVRELFLASLLTTDGTVHGHLGRARYAVGNDRGAFPHLLRALAMGTEDEDEVRDLARHLYENQHVVPGGLDALVQELREQIRRELDWASEAFDLGAALDPGALLEGGETAPSRAGHPLLGLDAPTFRFTTLAGEEFDNGSLLGRVVVVDFWAIWCGPCRESLPVLDALSRAFEDEDVVFLAMSMDDSEDQVRGWWSLPPSPMRVGMADEGVPDSFGVLGIPATFLIDKSGRIADYHAGFDPTMAEAMTRTLVELLAN